MKEVNKELKEDIFDEERAIEEVLERLFKIKAKFNTLSKEDYSVEPAMGTYLMNFYNGVENILKRIAKNYYFAMPKGESWHKELLNLAFNPPQEKVAIFSREIAERLHAYRNFRHRFISGYGFQLKGEKMIGLIDNIEPLWDDIKKAMSDFWDKI
ncbi:MAG: hypothetical protein KKC11_01380 [Candidatus Omnitrophica bacterium]|nr:hypothetical protein [Candidatus Omnitrophota bacterium]MBU0897089.1 hypothetical protein [Candidatus Omnitrophota bacterium]MBU1134097.1 hypothetical protein [Candidatus Omnitrophota bacterium]MBU1366935.1 hypothetical protein [Candidatus Omnitrophota bacterium]MBU1523933.1 hypothetical protein [Candidatus Omnitrophota bacterium]